MNTELNIILNNRDGPSTPASSAIAIPLPPPPIHDYLDVGAEPISDTEGVEHGPFLPPNGTFNNLFADASDIQEDAVVGEFIKSNFKSRLN